MNPGLAEAARRVARTVGTPAYLYDLVQLEADARAVRAAFPEPWELLYALDANGLPGLARQLHGAGYGAAATSSDQLVLAARAGFPPDSTVLEGIGKTPGDLRAAVRLASAGTPLRWISLESADEAAALARLARSAGRAAGQSMPRIDVLVRLGAPRAEPRPDPAAGGAGPRSGVTADELPSVVAAGGGADGPLRWRGLHVHAGSQLQTIDPWRSALRLALAVMAISRAPLPEADTVDAGSGFPAAHPADAAPSPAHFAAAAGEVLAELPAGSRPARLAIEPGRVVVARCGWLLARVLHVRDRDGRGVVLDAGIAELLGRALGGGRHPLVALTSLGRACVDEPPDRPEGLVAGAPFEVTPLPLAGRAAPRRVSRAGAARIATTIVDGAGCEAADRLGAFELPALRRGDLVAIGLAGAYAASWSDGPFTRPAPAAVTWDGERLAVLRSRGGTAVRA